ncbi:prolyl hydroxylase EGLN3 isoform X2 [Hyperolius riggenbachi]|uniref:prolyl hydroxylase EGLN3 isoform X2 n=1 Tax=Hyperolius riggenbachi TaxID=752182 RepID=UPI0035A2ABAF
MPLNHSPSVDLEKLALEHIAPRLLSAGYCYVDNVLGEEFGDKVLAQVRRLHQEGVLKDGQLAGRLRGVSKKHLRGDKITWVAGNEEGCEAIGFVLSVIDRLVVLCGTHLGQYYVKERSKVHGGILRIFPDGGSHVADVEPLFDRLLFFWSDRRNPHEVQPSYATRYALTVWYFDAKERAAAKQRFKRLSESRQDSASEDS